MLRQARAACDQGHQGAACYQTALLYAEGNEPGRTLAYHAQGCAAKHAGSCDALSFNHGPDRATHLANACNGGDLVSCTRLADDFPKDAAGTQKAKALNEQVCRAGANASASSRELQGAAFACGKISRLHAKNGDHDKSTKLDALSTIMLTEALFRLEKQQDADVEAEIAKPPRTALDKDRAQRDVENARARHSALLASLDSGDPSGGKAGGGAPTDMGSGVGGGTPLNGIEQAFLGTVGLTMPPSNGGAVISDDAAHCKETGDSVSCMVAAAQLDPAGALDLHVAGCQKKPDACWSLVTAAEIALRKKDPARAQQLLEKGCELKSANACIRLANELELGERGIALDTAKAAKVLEKACDAGGARACYSLSTMAEDGRGIAKNPAKAKTTKTKGDASDVSAKRSSSDTAADEEACRRGRSFDRCESAAAAYQETDAAKAEELYRISCSVNKGACGLWGFAVDRLRRDDAARGNRLLQQGCDEGSSRACLVLGELTHLGYRSIARAEVPAATLYQKACELGDPHSCRVIAARYRSAKNTQKADELRDKAAKIEDGEPADRWAQAQADRRKGQASAAAASAAPPPSAGGDVGKARAEWRALVEKARGRAQARLQHLESSYAGRRTPAAPPFSNEDIDASAQRMASIKRVSDSVFAMTPPKPAAAPPK